MRNIVLIQPKSDVRMRLSPPLGLLRLASLTPSKYRVKIIDENIEKINVNDADLVGITVQTFLSERAYSIADFCRKQGIKVILGGIHVSSMPEEASMHADSVVIGEAESIWSKVLEDFSMGREEQFYKAVRPELIDMPTLNWNLVKPNYLINYTLQTSRGCPYNCDFCSVSLYNGRKIRHTPVREIVKEIKKIKTKSRKPHIFFADDNIFADPSYSKELFKAIIPLKIRWFGQASINIAENDELLDLAAKSGCRYLFIGLESICQRSLNDVNKPFKAISYSKAIAKIRKKGILIHAGFIFGMDSDDRDIFRRTLQFCRNTMIDFVAFHPLTPFPGTALFDRLKEQGRLLANYTFSPKNLTHRQLVKRIVKTYERFYSMPSILRRSIRFSLRSWKIKPIMIYLGLNMAMRHAVKKSAHAIYSAQTTQTA